MRGELSRKPVAALAAIPAVCALLVGCATPHSRIAGIGSVPRELQKVSLPAYVIEPPDILLVDSLRNSRVATELLETGDMLLIRVLGTLPEIPDEDEATRESKRINGPYRVGVDGRVDLGPVYGSVLVAGLPEDQARAAIERHLRQTLAAPQVSVTLAEFQVKQAVSGEHLVQPDGAVALGIYGDVYVAGMTRLEAKQAIEDHLSQFIHDPEVDVTVFAFNSKVYYVITDGGGYGEQVFRFPLTGSETVLDAISQINGLPSVSSKKRIWIARPTPPELGCQQVLPVDWNAQGGSTETNYQILPGDRIYVEADHWIAMDSFVAKVTAPFERIFGFTLLGNSTVRALQGRSNGNTGAGGF
jgi:polysaccharide export outer membrane protein